MAPNKLSPSVAALATGSTAALLSLICAILVGTQPVMMQRMAGMLTHSFAVVSSYTLTLQGVIFGLLLWFIIGAVSGYVFALWYNFWASRIK